MPLWIIEIAFIGRGAEPLWIPVGRIGRWIERAVSENHRVINKKFFILVLIDEVADKISADLRTIFSVDEVLFLAIDFQQRIDEPPIDPLAVLHGPAATRMLPKAGLLKPKMLWGVRLFAQLPFASDAGCIPRPFQLMSERGLTAIKNSKLDIIPDIILTGHNLHPRRCTQRVGETIGETHSNPLPNLSRFGVLQDSLPFTDSAS